MRSKLSKQERARRASQSSKRSRLNRAKRETLRVERPSFDRKRDASLVVPGNMVIFRHGINRPETVIGRIVATYSAGLEVFSEGFYMVLWESVRSIHEPKTAKAAHNLEAAADEAGGEDAMAAKRELLSRSRRQGGDSDDIE